MRTSRQVPLWALVASATGAAVWGWRRERDRKQSAERLAAATLESLLSAVDANDQVTGQHLRRTAAYALCIAEALGMPQAERRKVERVALFHDIGKIHAALFDIVHDDARLTSEERQLMATHPQRGADVLEPLASFYPELPDGVLAHHERWDGEGYPRQLKGTDIPIYARIVALADTFDAITHSRRYHAGEGVEHGLTLIAEGRGTQFDPDLTDTFLSSDVSEKVRQTFAQSAETGLPTSGTAHEAPGDRRSSATDRTVPDVQFRWREPSAVAISLEAPADGTPSDRT